MIKVRFVKEKKLNFLTNSYIVLKIRFNIMSREKLVNRYILKMLIIKEIKALLKAYYSIC